MLTYNNWKENWDYDWYEGPQEILFLLLQTILTIPIDIILSPIEIIAYILYKFKNRKRRKNKC